MAAFVLGIVVSIPFMSSAIYTGPVADTLDGADVSYFVSFVVAGIIYSFSSRPVFRKPTDATSRTKPRSTDDLGVLSAS